MVNYQVEVNGTPATDVTSVEYDRTEGADVAQATITVLNTAANRSLFASGDDVVIKREAPDNPGSFDVEWAGEVAATPSTSSQRRVTLTVEAEATTGQIEYGKIGRPFIQVDSGDAVAQAIDKVVEPETSPEFVTTGSSTSGWESNANTFELADITEKSINEFGSNLLYADFREGVGKTWYIRNRSVGTAPLPGRRLLKVEMRALINNRGNVFTGELEVRDYDGVNYVWSLDIPGYAGFKTYELVPEDAEFGDGQLTTDGSVELRLSNVGGIPEDRALVIDMIRTTPFRLRNRDTSVTTGGVESTGRTITRRLNGSILKVANTLATEDGAVFYVDTDDVAFYETAGDTSVPPDLNIIDDGPMPIIDVTVDRDYDVRNRVTVQGRGDIQATFEDSASIEFYNREAPREEAITDTSIRTRAGLEERARGFLNENAWEDTAMSFTIADGAFKDVGVGQAIDIEYSPEDISGTFIVSSVSTTAEGFVTIGATGTTTT